jgi:protein SCO1
VSRTALPAALLAVSLCLLVGCTTSRPQGAAQGYADSAGYLGGSSLPEPYRMPDITLTDTSGQPYKLANSPSKPVTLLFFGYTKCPDVCVTVLADLATALQRMPSADRDHIQVVFVTTDPARDNGKQIRAYLNRFDPTFVGLTGQLGTIKKAAGQVGVDIEGMERLPSGGYEVGHSAQVIGFDRTSGVVLWTPETPIAALIHDFGLLVERSR